MAIQFSSVSGGGYATMRSMPTAEQLQQKSQQLFSQLDQSNKGYLEQSDFDSLLSGLNDSAVSDSSADLFAALDSDSDGKLTSTEFSEQASQLMYNAQGQMPPPPPRGGMPSQQDSGKTADELSAMLEQTDSSDPMSGMLQSLIDNFDAADADGDGKVTMQEAKAYQESQQSDTAASTSSATAETQSTESDPMGQLLQRTLQQLMKTYGSVAQPSGNESALQLTA
ncbi:EF-hand domain-containing protein [Rheinheimera sp.]|uniref:EF-hand domain-containing protein n=1 Tax=Rheinheimera sp. TaxID=1869214 RepID=UPI00307D6F5E